MAKKKTKSESVSRISSDMKRWEKAYLAALVRLPAKDAYYEACDAVVCMLKLRDVYLAKPVPKNSIISLQTRHHKQN